MAAPPWRPPRQGSWTTPSSGLTMSLLPPHACPETLRTADSLLEHSTTGRGGGSSVLTAQGGGSLGVQHPPAKAQPPRPGHPEAPACPAAAWELRPQDRGQQRHRDDSIHGGPGSPEMSPPPPLPVARGVKAQLAGMKKRTVSNPQASEPCLPGSRRLCHRHPARPAATVPVGALQTQLGLISSL